MGLRAAGRAGRRLSRGAGGRSVSTTPATATSRSRSACAERLRYQAEAENAEAQRADDNQHTVVEVATARAIDAARWRPILFRETFPPPADPGLSFYGGVPVGPVDMSWPLGADRTPLSFVMQWDCAALAQLDATGLLPRDGALYLFGNLGWGNPLDFQFVHQPVDGTDWAGLAVPIDLPPAFGDQSAHASPFVSAKMPVDLQHPPALLPRWPFVPVAIDYPRVELDEDEGLYWSDRLMEEALVLAQDPIGALVSKPGGRRWIRAGWLRKFVLFSERSVSTISSKSCFVRESGA